MVIYEYRLAEILVRGRRGLVDEGRRGREGITKSCMKLGAQLVGCVQLLGYWGGTGFTLHASQNPQ